MPAAPTLCVHVSWRAHAPTDEKVRARIVEELRQASWTLNQLEALLFDAHHLTAGQHAWMLPRLELRLPLYDVGLRYRLVYQCLDKPRLALQDEKGRRIADVSLP